jgi:hypothetical protein
MRIRHKNDGLGPMLDQDVLRTSMVAMDSKTPTLDSFTDAMSRPGFRSSNIRDARENVLERQRAYQEYHDHLTTAWMGDARKKQLPQERDEDDDCGERQSKDAGSTSAPKGGGLGSRDSFLPMRPLKQIAHPGEEPEDEEEEDRERDEDEDRDIAGRTSDGATVSRRAAICPTCKGVGTVGWHHHDPADLDDLDDDEAAGYLERGMQEFQINKAVKEATTNHEGSVRRDVPDARSVQQLRAQHAKQMDKLYADSDAALREAWRKGG